MGKIKGAFVSAVVLASILAFAVSPVEAERPEPERAQIVAGTLAAVARHLALRPDAALDFKTQSGAHCINFGFGKGGHMVHYAVDPTKNQEGVVDFVDARPLIASGLEVEALPRFPGGLGTMQPGQWYYLPAGELEPHHKTTFKIPILMRATDVR